MRMRVIYAPVAADLPPRITITVSDAAGKVIIRAIFALDLGLAQRLDAIEKFARIAALVAGVPARSLHIAVLIQEASS